MTADVVLVAHHDDSIRTRMRDLLEEAGLRTDEARDWASVLSKVQVTQPELVVVAARLGGDNVLTRLERARALGTRGLVVIVSPSDRSDGPRALDAGADDYFTLDAIEYDLVPRVRALRRILGGDVPRRLEYGPLVIDLAAHEVLMNDQIVDMTPREYKLLTFLSLRPGTAFTREELLQRVWGAEPEWQRVGTVTEHVRRLRSKLAIDEDDSPSIKTVRGTGYLFKP